MKPLEIMAKAAFERQGGFRWEDYHLTQVQVIKDMRAALLALAEVELPESVVATDEVNLAMCEEDAESAFRAIIRSIASSDREGTGNG